MAQNPRVLILADGASIHTQRWLEGLSDVGTLDLFLVSMNPAPVRPEIYKIRQVKQVHQIAPPKISESGNNFQYLFHLPAIWKVMREIKPNIISAVYLPSYGFVGALLWALVRTPQKSPTEHHIVRYWIGWSLRRALLFPAVWVVTHVTVFLWRASDPSYLSTSEWVAQYILKPIHPYTVSVVGWIIPFGSTYLANLEPTHEDAVKIYYPLIMSAFGLLVLGGYLGIVAIVEHMRAPIIIAPPRRSLQAAIRTGRPTSRIPTRK